ncbi:unnamed protein product [Aspergillus oryzae]|uniref:Unnamed protein product n=1 Tax=Aspergillus oryzae var. brunneus TaxID=332754 RepID=A0ABQ6KZ61_ASPOZ|nr:unnamed protein product [Aspergillus oryzae]GMF92826.1 unnamed protein product [Aspergillus oryzae]GMG06590.1 unnamed protein product [Aspergillus oryzae]GMG49581.1 unnamed protein product [Aspergillus oryzae var. brunneus]
MGLSTASPSSGDPGQRPVRSNEVLNLGPYTGNEPNYSNDGFEMGRLPSRPENEAQEPCSVEEKSRGNWRIAAIMLALSTIVATATPTISAELHSGTGYVWIGGAYLIANAASSNIWANLSDIWGRKPILLTAVALFFGASIICAKAINMPMLIAGRGVQGIAGGGLIQLITIIISDLFSVRLRSLFLGLIEFIWAIAGALGPIVGGAFTQSVSWRWIFWINLPVCGTAFVLLLLFLDVHNPKTGVLDGIKAVDWFGSFSILGLTVMVLLGLDFGGATFPWSSPKVICLIVFGCLMSLFFIYSEKRLAKYPLMPLGIFKNRSNMACFIVAFTHGFVSIQTVTLDRIKPDTDGLRLFSDKNTISRSALSLAAGLIIHRTGHYLEVVWTGTALVLLGSGLLIDFNATSSLAKIICYQIVAGAGCGLLFFPPLLALQSNVPQDENAAATATFGFIRNMAMAMSVVLGGVIFQNGMDARQSDLLTAGLSDSMVKELTGSEAAANVMVIQSIADTLQRSVVKDAYAWSMRNIWILYTSLGACGLLVSLFITRQHLSVEHVETKTGLKEKQPLTEPRQNESVSEP